MDPEIVDLGVESFLANDCDVVNNVRVPSFPQGADVQVFRRRDLAQVAATIDDPAVREHVSLYFYEHPERFRVIHMLAPTALRAPDLRLQLDYPEDLRFIREVYARLEPAHGPTFGVGAILEAAAPRTGAGKYQCPLRGEAGPVSDGKFRTALLGFGRMASGYALDAAMARHYRYATHAQVLAAHPRFDWCATIDPAETARAHARDHWRVDAAADIAALGARATDIEVAVLSTPPDQRLAIIEQLPRLRAVLVEKPLGTSLEAARLFLETCARRGIQVQVNLWRRADRQFRALAAGQLRELIGAPQSVCIYYGNGLLNNGIHMIDFARMLFGEVADVQRIGTMPGFREGPIEGDCNAPFALAMRAGPDVLFQPLRFARYRENGMIAWGDRGRLDLLNEGLTLLHYPAAANRAMSGESEVSSDAPRALPSTVGEALYDMYDNLAAALDGRAALVSPGDSALAEHPRRALVATAGGRVTAGVVMYAEDPGAANCLAPLAQELAQCRYCRRRCSRPAWRWRRCVHAAWRRSCWMTPRA